MMKGARRAAMSAMCSTFTVGACANGNCAIHPNVHFPNFDPSVATRTFMACIPSYPLLFEQATGSNRCLNASDDRPLIAASVSYTHLRAHETPEHLVCRLLL